MRNERRKEKKRENTKKEIARFRLLFVCCSFSFSLALQPCLASASEHTQIRCQMSMSTGEINTDCGRAQRRRAAAAAAGRFCAAGDSATHAARSMRIKAEAAEVKCSHDCCALPACPPVLAAPLHPDRPPALAQAADAGPRAVERSLPGLSGRGQRADGTGGPGRC